MPSGNGLGPHVRDNTDGTICVEYEPKLEGRHEVQMNFDGSSVEGKLVYQIMLNGGSMDGKRVYQIMLNGGGVDGKLVYQLMLNGGIHNY